MEKALGTCAYAMIVGVTVKESVPYCEGNRGWQPWQDDKAKTRNKLLQKNVKKKDDEYFDEVELEVEIEVEVEVEIELELDVGVEVEIEFEVRVEVELESKWR